MEIKYKNKKIDVPDVKKCKGFSRGKGLMFSRKEKTDALLFEFSRNVNFHLTSFFVFFPFVAVWLDEDNNVLEIRRVKPFQLTVPFSKSYMKILEIPINKKYERLSNAFLVGDAKDLNT